MFKKYLRRLRFLYWYIKSFSLRYGAILLISFFFGFFSFKIFFPYVRKILLKKPVVKIGLTGMYTETNLPLSVQQLISYGLTSLSASGSAQPALASSWEIKNNGKTYILKIKNNVYWQDGKKFTAYDINYNFKDVEGKAINENHFQFSLKEPFSPFLALLSQPLFKKGLLGLGLYRVVTLEKNAGFIRTLKLESKNNIIIYKFYPNEKATILAFKLGEIDVIKGISSINSFKNFKNVKIDPELKVDTAVILFFNNRHRYFKEKFFRQALTYAIFDKDIKEVRAYSPISPISWAYNEEVKKYKYNINEAKRLIEKSGVKAKDKIVITAIKPHHKYLKTIANSWRKLGLKVEERLESVLPYKFDVLLASQEIFQDPDQYIFWHSNGDKNITGYNSAKIDKFLEDGRKILDMEERKKKYLDFQKYLVEDCPAAFLYHPTVFNITRIK